jgi:ATP-dependent DNA helicase RecG
LIANDANEESELRLKTFASINDGFELAEADLKIRGPGEIYGTKQSGLPNIRIASLLDARLIDRAKQEATAILENNYDFSANDKKKIAELTNILSSTTIHEIH